MDGISDGLKLPPRSAMAASVLVAAFLALVDFVTPVNYNLSIAYGVPVAIAAWTRRPAFLWTLVAILLTATYADVFFGLPSTGSHNPTAILFNRSLVAVSTLLTGGLVYGWIRQQRETERVSDELRVANEEVSSREEEVARQNEELQNQTEEMERQSEELRVVNDELAEREKTLRSLLELSRSLTVELTPGETMSRICETLGQLVNGPATASAILLREGDEMVVRCHYGLGDAGLREERIPCDAAFASLVFAQRRSGYLEDVALLPDLRVPQPAAGEPIVSVLAVPLTVGGKPIGTLELYSRNRRSWGDEQIVLAESLAAQTAISLENAQLFQDIERERTRLSTILRAVPFGIIICDHDCTQLRANPAGAAMLNVSPEVPMTAEQAFGHLSAFRDGQSVPVREHPVVIAARAGREIHGDELEWHLPGGRRIHVLISAVPLRGRDGTVTGAISVKADITQLKTLQRELDVRRREAEEASVRKTRFLAAASHDIRTPANAISLIAELIKRTSANSKMVGEIPQLADELQQSAMSLVNLVTNVLDVTRFETGALDLVETEFPLSALLDEEVRQMLPLAQAKKLEFRVEQPDEPLWLRTDRVKLGRVMGNLLGNAIKFTDRGQVRV